MPTRPDFDVIPVRKDVKRRLAAIKGARTYSEVVSDLLNAAGDATHPAPPAAPRARERHPEEQLALADLSARRWQRAVASGRIEVRGPRLFALNLGKRAPRRSIDVSWTGRRGIPP